MRKVSPADINAPDNLQHKYIVHSAESPVPTRLEQEARQAEMMSRETWFDSLQLRLPATLALTRKILPEAFE